MNVKRLLARLWLASAADPDRALPAWIRTLMEQDAELEAHVRCSQRLSQRLRNESRSWIESARSDTAWDTDRHLVPARPRQRDTAILRPSRQRVQFAVGAVLLMLAGWLYLDTFREKQQGAFDTGVRSSMNSGQRDARERQLPAAYEVDWRPLLATASAGELVARRITDSTTELLERTGQVVQRLGPEDPLGPVRAAEQYWLGMTGELGTALEPLADIFGEE